jgi:hypothetical protein
VIINAPEISTHAGEVTISARVETRRLVPYLPDRLWFRFPQSYREYISGHSNGFLSALILIAMHLGEDLQVRGSVSPLLAQNLGNVQAAYHEMHPGLLKQVKIHYDKLETLSPVEVQGAVISAFSGGIDSSYTLWSHLPENEPDPNARLTHGLFIHGFDFFLYQESQSRRLYQTYADMFAQLGLQLLQATTNAYAFSQFRFDWGLAHDPVLAGTAMILDRLVGLFYKPGSGEMKRGTPTKPTVYCFHHLSTETLICVLDRPDLSRTKKLHSMIEFPFIREGLRVCMATEKTPDGTACYRCEKCLNTLVYLELFGIREKFKNFPHPLSMLDFVRFCWGSLGMKRYYYPELPRNFLEYRRYDLYMVFMLMLIPNQIKNYLRCKIVAALPIDTKYRLSRRLFANQLPPEER